MLTDEAGKKTESSQRDIEFTLYISNSYVPTSLPLWWQEYVCGMAKCLLCRVSGTTLS